MMAPFSIPAPNIIPLRLPIFGGPKSIDTNTKIQLLCETYLEHEIFYTLDGTKPQPYARIVQGSITMKYASPFCLPPGKIAIKAIAINANIHTMCSNVVTKCFEVLKSEVAESDKGIRTKNSKLKIKQSLVDCDKKSENGEAKSSEDASNNKLNARSIKKDQNANCFDEAFIDSLVLDVENSHSEVLEDSDNDQSEYPVAIFDSEFLENISDDETVVLSDNQDEINEMDNESFEVKDNFPREEKTIALLPDASQSQNSETQFCCQKCDMTLQQCLTCNRLNAVSSKYCIECGTRIAQICFFCKEHNPSVASFCQYCGKKLEAPINSELEPCLKVDNCIMVKPKLKNASIQNLPTVMTKSTQTNMSRSPVRKSLPRFDLKGGPRQSPGRGYWHQQLDYICNNLKSHAYNNLEFRKTISEPALCDFQSAHITKDQNNVTVTIVFSPLIDKNTSSTSEDIKSKDNI